MEKIDALKAEIKGLEDDIAVLEDAQGLVEECDLGGMENMKKKIGIDVNENAVSAFEDFLKSGEVRDVTGLQLRDGAVIIPETIMAPEHEEHQFPRLGDLVRKVAVTTTTG